MKEIIIHKLKHNLKRAYISGKWVVFAIIVGCIVGVCGTAFYFAMDFATSFRLDHPPFTPAMNCHFAWHRSSSFQR